MAKTFRIIAFLSLFLLAGFVGRVCVPHLEFMQALALDQKLSESPQDRTNSGKANKNGKTVPQGTSAAERIIQMQSTIETDKEKLDDLKRELAELQQEFKRDTAKLTELKGRFGY